MRPLQILRSASRGLTKGLKKTLTARFFTTFFGTVLLVAKATSPHRTKRIACAHNLIDEEDYNNNSKNNNSKNNNNNNNNKNNDDEYNKDNNEDDIEDHKEDPMIMKTTVITVEKITITMITIHVAQVCSCVLRVSIVACYTSP